MEYRPRSGPFYGPHGYRGGQGNGQGNGGYAGGYSNGTYTGGRGNGVYPYNGGDGRYPPPYGRGAGPSYGVGRGVGRPLAAAAMPSTSYGQGRRWGAWAPPRTILPEAMRAAEAAAEEVLVRVHPTEAAERRRQEIIDYAQRLIGSTFGCEVYAFGSVPLKTYLPDGDVDVTILTDTPEDSAFIDDVYRLLSSEANNDDAQFTVKKLEIIHAKVKLIKCVIENVVVDISFNQIGGVSTLCFLEMADKEIGREHLYKKSIILIKAWCCHERKIHGSNQWLLSTYALEILILYIFNKFHESLHGPLEALYKFLEYYSKFDWDKNCLTLDGPVPLSFRGNLNVEPGVLNDELLLNNQSVNDSLDKLIVLPIGSPRPDNELCKKHINIIDPLKGNNNLGKSISLDNSHVIRDAFKCDARNLGQILKLPSELIPDAIYGFFTTTLGRHGRGERPDLGDSFLFQSMLDSGNGHEEDVSSVKNSCAKKDENTSPDNLLGMTGKESGVKKNMHQSLGLTNFRSHSSSSLENGNTYIDSSSHHIFTSLARANSLDVSGSYLIVESKTDVRQEKLQLPPFSPSNLLDLSGDLGLPLKCFRSVQYNLEVMFDSVKEASLAGVLDVDCIHSLTSSLMSNTDGMILSMVKGSSQGTRDVPQESITEPQVDTPYQPLSGTQSPSRGLSLYPPAENYYHPWFQNTEDTPQIYGAGMYNADMNSPRTDTLPIGSTSYPVPSIDNENHPFSSSYIAGDNRKTRGTGTFLPKTARELSKEKSWYDNRQNQRQPDQVNVEKRPDRVNPYNGHAAVERELTNGGINQVPTSETRENGEQRHENGLMETPTLSPPRIALPHHGGESQGNLPVPSTVQPSPPAIRVVNNQPITSQQHENLEFGTIGPFSANRRTSKFMEDFPPLAPAKKPLVQESPPAESAASFPVEAPVSTVQSPKADVSVTQSRPVEAPASTVPSPSPGASASQSRPEESYKLKDDVDFPPLQAGTRYSADFPPLRAAPR